MRHLAVGQACPMDGATVTRAHCSGCPSFVSFRMTSGRATVGCEWGEDVADWLRREMRGDGARADGRPDNRAVARRVRAADARQRTVEGRGGPSSRAGGPPFRAGPSVGFFLAAFGLGIALSAWERPS